MYFNKCHPFSRLKKHNNFVIGKVNMLKIDSYTWPLYLELSTLSNAYVDTNTLKIMYYGYFIDEAILGIVHVK